MRPSIVIPMHYDVPAQAGLFADFVGARYPVRWIGESQLLLSRAMLPKATEIFILTHPRPILPRE